MNHEIAYLHCGEHLQRSLKNEIDEVLSVVDVIKWEKEFLEADPPFPVEPASVAHQDENPGESPVLHETHQIH